MYLVKKCRPFTLIVPKIANSYERTGESGKVKRIKLTYIGLTQWRSDMDTPPPQLREQSVHSVQSAQAPSIDSGRVLIAVHSPSKHHYKKSVQY